MFRLNESALPADFHFPADLKELGYFINDQDQIRSIQNPDQPFNFFISKNERMNVMQREAHNTCIRANIQSRLLGSSLNLTPLPLGTPTTNPHIPIYTSTNISTSHRLIVYVGESWQDLGVFAWRIIGNDSIASGSIIDFVHTAQQGHENPAILIANTGQLLWYRGGQRAVTQTTWAALPRRTAVSPPMQIDEVRNRVEGNREPGEHVKYIFDEVIPKMCREDVKVDVIGMGDGAPEVVGYLRRNWEKWEGKVQAVALGTGFMWAKGEVGGEEKFRAFWGDVGSVQQRARAYIQSAEPLDMPLVGRKDFACNCYSAGEGEVLECIMPKTYKSMLKFFQLVDDVPGYRELAGIGGYELAEDEGSVEEVGF
ncbi:MAG: hypothetical protein LQ338_004332 [Usnochroma carphineum]|nr:MAG: hypothetical protein LQ338_004332 [Usnochroma carphineum]